MKNIEILKECLSVKDIKETSPIIDKMTQIQNEIEFLDIKISDLISVRNIKKIKEHFQTLSESGKFTVPGVWTLKNKFHFKTADTPTAKKDKFGNLITSKPDL